MVALMDTAIVNVLVNLNEHDQNNAYLPKPGGTKRYNCSPIEFLGSAELYDNSEIDIG